MDLFFGRLGTHIYVVAMEISPRIAARHTLCVYSLWKLRDQRRQGTPSYIVTVETLRHGHARHTHLRGYRGNLNNVFICILFFRIPVVNMETRVMCVCVCVCVYVCMYICILYCSIITRRPFT